MGAEDSTRSTKRQEPRVGVEVGPLVRHGGEMCAQEERFFGNIEAKAVGRCA